MHISEKIILASVWGVSLGLIFFISKHNMKKFSLVFLVAQFPSWFLGLIVVELGMIEYPYRLFSKGNSTSFTFEFLILPIVSAYFNIYYPKTSNNLKKIIYTSIFVTSITLLEIFVEKYTDLIKYIHWEWYWSWITIYMFLCLTRIIYVWFFRLNKRRT